MADNYCDCGGWVIGAAHQLPAAAFDFSWGVQGPVIGCNNLRCHGCNQLVRSASKYTWSKQTLDRRADIYQHIATTESDEWAALVADHAVATADDERMYVCGCSVHVEDEQRALDEEADWNEDAPNWQCAGHTRLTSPTTIDGAAIAIDNADALVADHLLGNGVTGAPGFVSDYPSAWIHRLLHLFSHEPIATALGDIVAARITDADSAMRTAAIDLYRRDSNAPGSAVVVSALRDNTELFVGVANAQTPGDPLDEWLQIAVAHRATAGDTQALTALKHAALHAPPVQALLRAIGAKEPIWLRDHATDVLRAHPTRDVARRLLYVMAPGLGEELVASAIDMGTADLIARDVYLDLVRQLVRDDRGARIADALS